MSAEDPPALRENACIAGELLRHFGAAFDTAKIDRGKTVSDRHEVHMRIVEAGQHESPASVDDAGRGPDKRFYEIGCSDRYYSIGFDGEGLGHRVACRHSTDGRVDHHEIGGGKLSVGAKDRKNNEDR